MSEHKFGPDYGLDLNQFLGKPNTEATAKVIRDTIQKTVSEHPGVSNTQITYCGTLWKKMSLADKAKWFAFNRFPFRTLGEKDRQILHLRDQSERLMWKLSHPDADWADCPFKLELPNYLQPNPKGIIVTDMNLKLVQPIEFVTCDLTIKNEEGGK